MGREFRSGGDTGRTFESRLFGTAQVNPQFLLDLDKIGVDERGRFRSVGQVYEAFKRNYLGAGQETRGETSMSTDLRVAVEDALGITDENDELKFYSAVGTVIDHKFGVDAFFELTDPKTGAYARVTLDATLNKEKQQGGGRPMSSSESFRTPDRNPTPTSRRSTRSAPTSRRACSGG